MKKYLLKVSLDHFALGLTIPIVVIWQLSRGNNLVQVGIVVSIITIVTLLTDIPTGVLADKYGRKPSLVLGSLTLGLAFGILAISHSFFSFCLYGVMSGLGWALLSGAEEAYIFETSKSENKSYRNALSDVTIADEAATIGGLIGATIFTKYFGLQQTLLTAAALLVIATFVSIIVLSEPSQHLSEVATNKESLASGGLQFLKRHSQYFLIMVVFAVYYEGGRLLWQPQLVNNGIQLYQLGVLFAFFKLFSIGGSLAAKKLAPQQFKEPLLLAGFILAMTFLMISSSTLALILIGFCIYSFAENYTRVLQSDYLNKAITHNRAGFLSLNNIVRNGYSAAIAPFLGVLALTKVSKGFIFLAVAQVLAIIVLALVMGAKKQPI